MFHCDITTLNLGSSFKGTFLNVSFENFSMDGAIGNFHSIPLLYRGGCGSVGRAGEPMIRRSLVQILAPWGGTELHVEVSLSKILNPKIAHDVQLVLCLAAISTGPVMSHRLIQGVPWPSPIEFRVE